MKFSCAADGSDTQVEEKNCFHIAILGEDDTGKSTLLARLYQLWSSYHRKKSKKDKTLKMAATDVLFQLGTKGNNALFETFELYSRKQYQLYKTLPKCDAFVIVYSLLSQRSFEQAQAAWDQIVLEKGADFPVVMVGNKADVAEQKNGPLLDPTPRNMHRKVSTEQDTGTREVLEELILQFHRYVESTRPMKKKIFIKYFRFKKSVQLQETTNTSVVKSEIS